MHLGIEREHRVDEQAVQPAGGVPLILHICRVDVGHVCAVVCLAIGQLPHHIVLHLSAGALHSSLQFEGAQW